MRRSTESTSPNVQRGPSPAELLLERHGQLSYPFFCEFGKAHLRIDAGVFCPALTHVSPFLLEAVDFQPGERVLDAFAGSGAFGINAALHGARQVVAFDTAEIAVANARSNAVRNHIEQRFDARVGTIDECLQPHEHFDLIVANPPLLPGDPTDALSSAVYDPGMKATISFVRALPKHLADGGRCYLLTSSVIEQHGVSVEGLCAAAGLRSVIIAKLDVGYECYRVHKITS